MIDLPKEILDWINNSSIVQSALFDLNLLPECIETGEQKNRLLDIFLGYRLRELEEIK